MKKRWIWVVAIALGAILLLTVVSAPNNAKLNSGSTYSRAPDGYGAWFAFMEQQGTPLKRWQKPFEQLPGVTKTGSNNISPARKNKKRAIAPKSPIVKSEEIKTPIVLLQINSFTEEQGIYFQQREWIEKGNTLIILGVKQPVTNASFSTQQQSTAGNVKIETTRRNINLNEQEEKLLGDSFGSVVWEEKLGKGKVIFATTSYLAANAYQDQPGNYKFLGQLVTEKEGNSIFVDEYIHGYKDKEVVDSAAEGDWLSYLANTPIFAAVVQIGVILVIAVLAASRRFGPPQTVKVPVIDNSKAYINALAEVLQKADTSEFVMEVIAKEEQLQLQKLLGLGTAPVENEILISAWVQQTGRSPTELERLLQVQSKKRRLGEKDLVSWLKQWQTVQSYVRS